MQHFAAFHSIILRKPWGINGDSENIHTKDTIPTQKPLLAITSAAQTLISLLMGGLILFQSEDVAEADGPILAMKVISDFFSEIKAGNGEDQRGDPAENGQLVGSSEKKQGRIHDCPCHGRLGWGSNELGRGRNDLGRGINNQRILIPELFYLQTAQKRRKSKVGRMDGPTDRPTDRPTR